MEKYIREGGDFTMKSGWFIKLKDGGTMALTEEASQDWMHKRTKNQIDAIDVEEHWFDYEKMKKRYQLDN